MNGDEIKEVHLIAPDENLIITEGEDVNKNLLRSHYKNSLKNSAGDEIAADFNIAIIGPASVGKSSLVIRYVYNTFSEEYTPTLEDQYKKFEKVDEELFGLNILDTSGTEDFLALIPEYLHNKDGLVLAFSLDKAEHFKQLESFVSKINYEDPKNEIPKIVVANKSDFNPRQVALEDGQAYAKKIGAGYVEASAKTDHNVTAVFVELTRMMRSKRKSLVRENSSEGPGKNYNPQKSEEEKKGFMSWLFSKCNLI